LRAAGEPDSGVTSHYVARFELRATAFFSVRPDSEKAQSSFSERAATWKSCRRLFHSATRFKRESTVYSVAGRALKKQDGDLLWKAAL